MSYDVSLSDSGDYIHMRIYKDITVDMQRKFAEEAVSLSLEHKVPRFLTDVRGAKNLTLISDQYFMGYRDLEQFKLDKSAHIAILADPKDKSHNFIETVFRNAGYHCQLFTDKQSAISWLNTEDN